jgi:hypothetical protein
MAAFYKGDAFVALRSNTELVAGNLVTRSRPHGRPSEESYRGSGPLRMGLLAKWP